MSDIEKAVETTMTVAPGKDGDDHDKGDAGRDETIVERLERDPDSKQARLDRALDESMDASDPPATTQPVHNHNPAPPSGDDAPAEENPRDSKPD